MRGDAVAGIIITVINIIGGLIIGVLQHGLTLKMAAQNYTLLTVGEGLVAQIPSLIISTSAGIVVSRAASEKTSLGDAISRQLFVQPRALAIASVILLVFMTIPGMPKTPFLLLSGMCAVFSRASILSSRRKVEDDKEAVEAAKVVEPTPVQEREVLENLLPLDPIALEVGYGLIALVDSEQNGELLERIKSVRRQFALEMGFVVPPIHIRDNLELKPGGYSVLVRGCEVASGEMMANHLLAMAADDQTPHVDGTKTTEPGVWPPGPVDFGSGPRPGAGRRNDGRRSRHGHRHAPHGNPPRSCRRTARAPGNAGDPRFHRQEVPQDGRGDHSRDPHPQSDSESPSEPAVRARVDSRHADGPGNADRQGRGVQRPRTC